MKSRPSDSDLLSRFTALALADQAQPEGEEFLQNHGQQLSALLGKSATELSVFFQHPLGRRTAALRTLVTEGRHHRTAERQHQATNLALAGASHVAGLAKWDEDRVRLDERIVLGSLLSDTTRKYVRFDAEGLHPVCVHRSKLRDASRVLRRFPDLTCFLDGRGLNFRWRAGKGGLVLVNQVPKFEERQSVLSVVIVRPQPKADVFQFPAEQQPRPPMWLGQLAGALGSF